MYNFDEINEESSTEYSDSLSENNSFQTDDSLNTDDLMIANDIELQDIEEIADWEDNIEYEECIPNKYYIGTYKILPKQNILLFAKKIHISTFYKYSNIQLSEYFYWYSGIYICSKPCVEILQVTIDHESIHSCIIKTFWIKIIQRTWKRVFHSEKAYIKQNILSILDQIQRTGKPHFNRKIVGLLSIYQK
jgi:hypothetical protein